MNYPIEDESQDRPISTPEEAGELAIEVYVCAFAGFIVFGLALLFYAANPGLLNERLPTARTVSSGTLGTGATK